LVSTTYTTSASVTNWVPISNWSVTSFYPSGPTYNDFSYSSGATLTIPVDGIYLCCMSSGMNPGTFMYCVININNVDTYYSTVNVTGDRLCINAFWSFPFKAGDKIGFAISNRTGLAQTVFTSTFPGYLSVIRLTT